MYRRQKENITICKGKGHITYKGRPMRITPEFSPQMIKSRRSWTNILQTQREHKCQPQLLLEAKVSILIDRETKIFCNKTKFKQFLSTNVSQQWKLGEKFQQRSVILPKKIQEMNHLTRTPKEENLCHSQYQHENKNAWN